jgi:hypothetical protein
VASYTVDFSSVSTAGLESSPVADALAGLRANEARYFTNKYDHEYTVVPAEEAAPVVEWVARILREERDIVLSARPLQVADVRVAELYWPAVYFENGLAVNVLWDLKDPGNRAVGFKLSDGMDVPAELAEKFKFARQRSKLAGTIRGSYFKIKGDYPVPPER